MPEARLTRYLVTPPFANQRLDQGLAALTGLSRRKVKELLPQGLVWLNGKPCRVAARPLRLGDVLDLLWSGPGLQPPPALPPPLPIVFEDGWFVVIDKPGGMLSQPAPQQRVGELSALEHLCLQLSFREGHRMELLLVHRLDRVASGLLLFAKHHDAAGALSRQFASTEVEKRYVAVVTGTPPSHMRINAPIAPDPLVAGRFHIAKQGRKALTYVRLLAQGREAALVEVQPITGRTHQIRVHLASIGCPIAGDSLYGSPLPAPRPMLHAAGLTFSHPKSGQTLQLNAPLPPELVAFCSNHGVPFPVKERLIPAPLSSCGS
ncbi:MAG: RluA family pseudouridine synthase [Thermoanaerobaculum sp.]|nr:RluA family pseudouridine synthase [Thermoanaerobaculum sp.]MDW7968572.1 RluA family pseudouridine synthase [Thermoanaerobaculum sp.]